MRALVATLWHGPIISGTGANTVDGKTEAKGPGSLIYEPFGLVHQWGNPGNEPLTFLAFNINPEGVASVPPGAPAKIQSCTLSSAISAGLAKGLDLAEAVRTAKDIVNAALAAADRIEIGSGRGPVHHFHATW